MTRFLSIFIAIAFVAGCDKTPAEAEPIRCDGSSTVYPMTRDLADRFASSTPAKLLVSASGSGSGFDKLCRGEIDIAGASRPIRREEARSCERAKVDFIELPIALDAIAIVVHPDNDWVDELTTEELETIWRKSSQGKVETWSAVRDGWPSKPLNLYGPGLDSGTFDYFNAAILDGDGSRSDYDSSERDEVIVKGVSSDPMGLGYFSLAYAKAEGLRVVPIDDGNDDNGVGSVPPSLETVKSQTYQPLTRPIFLYVSTRAARREDVRAFVDFYLDGAPSIAEGAGFAPLPPKAYAIAQKRFSAGQTGSLFEDGSQVGMPIEQLLRSTPSPPQ